MYKRQDESAPTLTETGSLTVTDVDGADEAKFVAGAGTPSADALGSLTLTHGGARARLLYTSYAAHDPPAAERFG
ncbi:hypothetical protein, partial [Aeromonas salmonicida]|uniref:hypothetical protein n=1 Tax=Aeromonas salmonicida TaxID=645 RepID=UPI003D3158EC